jgi:hypothetical protein
LIQHRQPGWLVLEARWWQVGQYISWVCSKKKEYKLSPVQKANWWIFLVVQGSKVMIDPISVASHAWELGICF